MSYKIADFSDVKELNTPRLRTAWGRDTVHIVDREAKLPKDKRRAWDTPERWYLTRCNRALSSTNLGEPYVPNYLEGIQKTLGICKRCGTPEEILEIKREYERVRRENRECYKREAEERRERMEQARAEKTTRIARLGDWLLRRPGLILAPVVVFNYSLVFVFEGRAYRIREVDRSEQDELLTEIRRLGHEI